MKMYVATVHLLINADNHAKACDTVSALLTETGLYEGDNPALLDWAYVRRRGIYISPREVQVPEPYDRDEEDLETIARRGAA